MPKNEDGEFELILGNRQLLSVFFIVVVLLGVFFTMGYIVGKNSTPSVSADSNRKPEPRPIAVDRSSPSGGSPTATTPAETAQAAVSTPASAAMKETPPPAEPKKAEPKAERVAAKPEPASPTPDVPTPGSTYLQVAAVARAEAQLFVDVMAKKGFHALYTPVPNNPSTFRVLVGPFQDSAAVAQARTDLNKAGFKGFEALVRKY
jgi:cell division septation protein DedD